MVLGGGLFTHPRELEQPVRAIDPFPDQAMGFLRVPEVADPDPAPADLVLIRGPDATPGGSDLLAPLSRGIEQLVIGKHQMGPIGNDQPSPDIDLPGVQGIQLLEQRGGIDHDAVAQNTHRVRVENAGGYQPQHELGGAHHDRVARVGATLVAHHQVGLLGEHIDDLPFALVAPLRPDDDDTGPARTEH